MNWYKISQQWQAMKEYIEDQSEERKNVKLVPSGESGELYQIIRNMGLRYEEVFEIEKAMRMVSSMATNPKYFINLIRSKKSMFPFIYGMSDSGLAKIWNNTYNYNWNAWSNLVRVLRRNLELERNGIK